MNIVEKMVDNSHTSAHQCAMTSKAKSDWIDPDDAPELPDEAWERAQIAIGGTVIREARGTLTRWFTQEELIERRKTAAASAQTHRPNKQK